MRTRIFGGMAIVVGALLFFQMVFANDNHRWVKFSSPEGRFEILMPGEPVTGKIVELPLPNFTAQPHPFSALRPPSFGLMCGYADFPWTPKNANEVFDRTREGSIKGVQGKLIAERSLSLGGYSGRRFRSTAQGNSFIDEEMYLVGRRFYLITVLSKTEIPDKDIDKVFDSFRFTPPSQLATGRVE